MSMNENNPLRQFFRRPAVHITLPSGGESYAPEDIEWPENKELPVYPMTAIDEITTKTPDALFNGTAMVEIIKSCVPSIKNPWALLSTDLDTVLISIKAAGGQETIDVESECENQECKALGTYGINLQVLLQSLGAGDYKTPLRMNELEIYFAPLKYKEMNEAGLKQFDIQAKYKNLSSIEDQQERTLASAEALKDITVLTMEILSQTIVKIVTPEGDVTNTDHIHDFLKNADTKTYETVRDHNTQLREKSTIKPLDIKCEECGHEYKQPFTLNASDFFV